MGTMSSIAWPLKMHSNFTIEILTERRQMTSYFRAAFNLQRIPSPSWINKLLLSIVNRSGWTSRKRSQYPSIWDHFGSGSVFMEFDALPHPHTLGLVYQQRAQLDFDVSLKADFSIDQSFQRFLGPLEDAEEFLEAPMDSADLVHQVAVDIVSATFHIRSQGPVVESNLGQLQRGSLLSDGSGQEVDVVLHLGYLLPYLFQKWYKTTTTNTSFAKSLFVCQMNRTWSCGASLTVMFQLSMTRTSEFVFQFSEA